MRAIVALLTFLILDAIWLGLVAKQMYIDTLGKLLRLSGGKIQPLWIPAIVVYVALIGGILAFVVPNAHGKLIPALLWGALFGFVTYATYDFTNLAVIANWPLKISIIDTLWGTLLCALTSVITVWIAG